MLNKQELKVIKLELDKEQKVLDDLERQYKKALRDIDEKIKLLQSDELTQSRIYQLQYQQALRGQVSGILDKLHGDQYATIQQYLHDSYQDGFIGTMYSIHGQGIPLIVPLDQDAAVKAIITDSKIEEGLYKSIGVNVKQLKQAISSEITRGIASNMPFADIARNISNRSKAPLSRAKTIVRTEAHRIQQAAAADARDAAKQRGCDVVKQWDSTLDSGTRPTHRRLDGQIREVNEPFVIDKKKKAMYPGDFGKAEEDCNCRCVALTRAKWALDEEELAILKQRAKKFGLMEEDSKAYGREKAKDFAEFKKKYLKVSETLKKPEENGIIDVEIDEFTPCLRDTRTGEIVNTSVKQIPNKADLKQYNEKTGWNVNWSRTPKDVDVYAINAQGNDAVQGLIGIKDDPNAKAVFIHWASTAPGNNKLLNKGKQDYEGVGGHLFAIAAQKSIELGYGGYMHGFAANKKVLEHYVNKLGAVHLGMLHPYHFAIDERAARKLLEVYSYEWK